MSLEKTIGNRDPWGMPSDGWNTSRIKKTRNWERREYNKARRRESQKEIDSGISEHEQNQVDEYEEWIDDILN